MTTHTIYKLDFTAPLHLSLGKNDYDKSARVLHSDTIKSAMIAGAYILGWSEDIIKSILDNVVCSSAFPYVGGEYFFPKPITKIQLIEGLKEVEQGKPLKKIQYLGLSYFEDLLNGGKKKKILNGDKAKKEPNHFADKGTYVSDHPDVVNATQFISSIVNQRVTISPDYSEDAVPYYTERIFFPDNTGLWLIVDCKDEKGKEVEGLQGKVEKLLSFLGDNGIGTDRSVGNGFFTVSRDSLDIKIPKNASHQINLSLYCPQKEEMKKEILDKSQWDLIKRGGYIASPAKEANASLRKRSVYMFKEGGLWDASIKLEGKIEDLQPQNCGVSHPVWRDGRAIFLPIKPKS